jgi:phosphoesterase RecJ-like protein
MIDHHANGSVYADNYIDPRAAATGEIIYAIAKRLCEMGEIEAIPMRVINCAYAAISSDTGGFRYSNASPNTHRIAAELIEAGVDSADINRQLFDSKSLKQVQAEGEAIRRLRIHCDGRVASTLMPYSVRAAMELEDEHLGTLIDIPRSVFGVDIAFAVREEREGGTFRVSMRSAIDFDVSKICAVFGGGGHKRAAGCTVKAESILDVEAKILEEINKNI